MCSRETRVDGDTPVIDRHGRRFDAGIGLIEVMIALAVLAFGMLAMTSAQLSSLKLSEESRRRSEAYYLAQQQVENFQNMSTAGVEVVRNDGGYPTDPLSPIDPDPNDGHVFTYTRTWQITQNTPETDVYTIAVTTGWTDALGNPRTVTIEGFKSEF
jgi:Tfp pilus assembly protein PilV